MEVINLKKDFGVKTWLYPMPVLMIATYNEDGSPNVMNATWGGTGGEELLTVCIDNTHKIWANIEKRKAFTISVGTAVQVKACDYLVVGKVVNVACDEAALTDGNPDAEKIAPITYDPVAHVYRPLAAPLGAVFPVERKSCFHAGDFVARRDRLDLSSTLVFGLRIGFQMGAGRRQIESVALCVWQCHLRNVSTLSNRTPAALY